jgi:hypothetical protein
MLHIKGKTVQELVKETGNHRDVIYKRLQAGLDPLKPTRKYHQTGLSKSPEHKIWVAMLDRAENPKHPQYNCYGGRGIKVCRSWHNFENFYSDMGPRPPEPVTNKSRYSYWSLDRINNDGDYEPDNCRWTDRKTNAQNRRNTINITFQGITKCLYRWAIDLGIDCGTLKYRWNKYGSLFIPEKA